jgi:hypothetical protein
MAKTTNERPVPVGPEGGTARFLQELRQTGEPIVLTLNGQAQLIIPDDASYQRLLDLVEQIETMEAIREGLEDLKAGRTLSLEEVRERFLQRHGLPD